MDFTSILNATGGLGLFLLGMVSRRAKNPAAIAGVIVGVIAILWLSLPNLVDGWDTLIHAFLVPVIGTFTILLVGIAVSALRKSNPPA